MKKLLILIIILLIIAGIVWLLLSGRIFQQGGKGVIITTNQKEYTKQNNPIIQIQNRLDRAVCFSSCYPYYLEKINDGPNAYQYGSCLFADLSESCMNPGEAKSFELLLGNMEIESGRHRVAVSVCVGCALKENFRRDKIFYSGEFIVK